MKIRRDTVFISSVLFTIALLWLVPPHFKDVLAGRDAVREDDFGLRIALRETASYGIASLAIILIGLIVTWTGYIKKVRWAWFVMFVIVWGWAFLDIAFPDFVYPLYRGALTIPSFSAFIQGAFSESELVRGIVYEMVIFALMMIALILPIKSFFSHGERRTNKFKAE